MPSASYQPGGLIVGDFPVAIRYVTILSGQVQPRGAVMGRVTASDKYILSLAAAGDGSETPAEVLAVDVDASGGDVVAPVYSAGEFAADQMTFGTGHDADTVETAFRLAGRSMFVRTRV
ncbi:head decoration protein [Roseibium sediminicola]|uniref:Head decoration protein n=1 Tax=Roseibium sediminicola TaxID=2933272 RepID=A0ABT0H0H2_9HYPH|nr:head decoration protein [Roseibium sp. CAU 1639]MCK7615188.1 head decoration protein [Roseibium sp. CAU 1639]